MSRSASGTKECESDALYVTLLTTCRSPKARRSIEHIKIATDHVISTGLERSISQVAEICVGRFGAPKYQSILNSKAYKAFIVQRFAEATNSTDKADAVPATSLESTALIGALRAKIVILESDIQRLKKGFRELAPISLSGVLGQPLNGHVPDPVNVEESANALSHADRQELGRLIENFYDLGWDVLPDGRVVTAGGRTTIMSANLLSALKKIAKVT